MDGRIQDRVLSARRARAAAQAARRAAQQRGAEQDGVVSRTQLVALGVPRWLVRHELRVGRWRAHGRQAVAVHNGPLGPAARRRVALFEAGPRAALDGVTALQAAGLHALRDEEVHVLVPKGYQRVVVRGAVVHESRRWCEADVLPTSPRRTRPAVAAVHAALWSRTERQAVYLLLLVVQQRLATPAQVAEALRPVRRHRFRRALLATAADLVHGVRSLGELDVARAMRRRGLPEPVRQALRRRPSGVQYLDCDFPQHQLTLEVDGAQHDAPEHRSADVLRDLLLVGEGRAVLRLPLHVWRLHEREVLDALEVVFRARGWRPATAAS